MSYGNRIAYTTYDEWYGEYVESVANEDKYTPALFNRWLQVTPLPPPLIYKYLLNEEDVKKLANYALEASHRRWYGLYKVDPHDIPRVRIGNNGKPSTEDSWTWTDQGGVTYGRQTHHANGYDYIMSPPINSAWYIGLNHKSILETMRTGGTSNG